MNTEKEIDFPALLLYWIAERWKIKVRKEEGQPKPWTGDWVFQTTYFCNVRREDDKVTKWIRNFYSPYVSHDLFEYNILLSRFLNYPKTLGRIGYQGAHNPDNLYTMLMTAAQEGKIWGNAYVITTHGIQMPKVAYLCRNVLENAVVTLDKHRGTVWGASLALAAKALQGIEGVGSFLSAQIVADLKNTPGHPLAKAEDFLGFVQPGPGSMRGAAWFHYGLAFGVTPTNFEQKFWEIRHYVDLHWPMEVPRIDNQDLQNCLCEFDKYCRVLTDSGRSKRMYNGIA